MDGRWVKGSKDKEARKKEINSYRNAFDELSKLLEGEFIQEDGPDYTSNSWAYEQADRNGHNRAIRKVLKLITIKDD
jgi:hypothetical protein